MDISFKTDKGRFNYRVCAVIINENKLLAMRDENLPYYYLPGGRVTLHETAENAIIRELQEELDIEAKIIRPLWLNQGFFNEDITKEQFHELCIYFLVDVSHTDLLERGSSFKGNELNHDHYFEWLPFEQLDDKYLYPVFIKASVYDLPQSFVLRSEFE